MINEQKKHDPVNHPAHYTKHPSGVECIQITEHMSFCLGNAMKYIWRAGEKDGEFRQDIQKAIWYLQRELDKHERGLPTLEDVQAIYRGEAK
jgi:hypothetical protein